MSCPPLETVAAWTLGELDEAASAAFEEHYFACDRCFQRAENMRRVHDKLERALPALLNRSRRERLEQAVPELVTVRVAPGGQAQITLGEKRPFGLWVMQAPLVGAERVDVEVTFADGSPLFSVMDVPFDTERGEVVLACQTHYRHLHPPGSMDLHVRLSKVSAQGAEPLGEYILEHVFESL